MSLYVNWVVASFLRLVGQFWTGVFFWEIFEIIKIVIFHGKCDIFEVKYIFREI